MSHIRIFRDAYPEQLMAATRDIIRQDELEQAARAEAARRRRERRTAMRARVRAALRR